MSKPNKKRYRMSAIVAEARKTHEPIEIEMDDDTVFTIDPPELWPDEAIDPAVGPNETMRAVLGSPERVAEFKAAGGSYSGLNLVIAAYSKDHGVGLGKSSASSAS